jgi:hypothetical protein
MMTCGSKRNDPSVSDGAQLKAIQRAEEGRPLLAKHGV